jgi:hypothetical protein
MAISDVIIPRRLFFIVSRHLVLLVLLVSFHLRQVQSFAVADGIRLRVAPLIGGPSWLPVHVQVVIEDICIVDFVPLNPTSKENLEKLLTLRSVPAEARFVTVSTAVTAGTSDGVRRRKIQRARQFCQHYSTDLHLISNNCWTFAYKLISFILQDNVNEEDKIHES